MTEESGRVDRLSQAEPQERLVRSGFDPARGEKWTKWLGGECPVDAATLVDVKWSNGAISHSSRAGIYAELEPDLWKTRERAGHIVAYRLAAERPAAAPSFGKYGLPHVDEIAIETLAGSLERLWSGGGGKSPVYTVAVERKRLRHALAAYLIRAIVPRDEIWRDLPRDSDRLPKGEDALAASCEASQSGLSESEGIAQTQPPLAGKNRKGRV